MSDFIEGLSTGLWLSGCLWAIIGLAICGCVGLALLAGGC